MGAAIGLREGVLGGLERVAAAGVGTMMVGLVGRGIQASRTPFMHEREGTRLGLDYTYVLIDFDQLRLGDDALGDVIAEAAERGFAGLNVTHPFKQAAIGHLDELSPEARAIGAVNTVVFGRGGAVGHNTDSWGFAESFRDGMAGSTVNTVVQFGAGGAGAAVAHALIELGVRDLTIIDTDNAKARDLAGRMKSGLGVCVQAGREPETALALADGIVNTTPIGMAKYPGAPFPLELLSDRHWVAEIIYFPVDTALLATAREKGCRTLPGTGMAVYQAVRAFELFTGRAPDRAAMAAHFEAAA